MFTNSPVGRTIASMTATPIAIPAPFTIACNSARQAIPARVGVAEGVVQDIRIAIEGLGIGGAGLYGRFMNRPYARTAWVKQPSAGSYHLAL